MGLITVIRHAQASFGAADYDRLSDLGHRQSEALGQALAAQGMTVPNVVFTGAQRRHHETLEGVARGLGTALPAPNVHAGWNEFDFEALLAAFYRDHPQPDGMATDRAQHFKALRETIVAWQHDEITNPPESYAAFERRVGEAAAMARTADADHVLVVSSGGAISQMIRAALEAPAHVQLRLQFQMKNCAVTRFIATPKTMYLHGYNETPHIDAETAQDMLTFS